MHCSIVFTGDRRYKNKPRHRYKNDLSKNDPRYKTDPWYKTDLRHDDDYNLWGAVSGRFGRIPAHNLGRAQIQYFHLGGGVGGII